MKKNYAELGDESLCNEYNGMIDSADDKFYTYDSVFNEVNCRIDLPFRDVSTFDENVVLVESRINDVKRLTHALTEQCIMGSILSMDEAAEHLYHITYNGIEAVNKDDARKSMISALKHSK